MDNLNVTLMWGALAFIGAFFINYFFILKRGNIKTKRGKKKKKTIENHIGFSYLVPRFELDMEKIDLKYVSLLISIANAFIIASVFVIVFLFPWDISFRLLLGFVLIFGLIYAIYELIGRHLVKKGWRL